MTVGEDRLKAEFRFAVLAGGEETVGGAGFGGEAGVELANPPKSSAANRSTGMEAPALLGAAVDVGAAGCCVKAKSSPLDADGEATVGFGAGALEGRLSKKPPPLSGGGEVICGADGAAFAGRELVRLPKLEKPDDVCAGGGGDLDVFVLEKFNPPNASARPPNASCFEPEDVGTAPKEGSRLCCGCGAGCGLGALAYNDKMELFKSPLVLVDCVGLDAALVGRPIPADGVFPKKSKLSSESCGLPAGFEAGAGAGGAVRVGLASTKSAVLGLTGGSGVKSSNRLTFATGRDCDCVCAGACRCEADLSILAFSCTMFKGMLSSPSASNVDGSGIGPSITHLLDSYLVRIKFSIFASEGTWPGASLASQYLLALALPHFRILCSCSSVQASRSTDLTRLM